MNRTNYLFYVCGKQNFNGVAEFQYKLLKICIEDEKFFNNHFQHINPSDFTEEEIRFYLNYMVKMKENDVTPTYELLHLLVKKEVPDYKQVIYNDYLDAVQALEIDDTDKAKIKNEYSYFALYKELISMANYIRDKAINGFTTSNELLNLYNKYIERHTKIVDAFEKLENNNFNNNNDNDKNGWWN